MGGNNKASLASWVEWEDEERRNKDKKSRNGINRYLSLKLKI